MVSQIAYLPLVFSSVAKNRYTSPTRAIVRPSVDFVRVSGWITFDSNFSRNVQWCDVPLVVRIQRQSGRRNAWIMGKEGDAMLCRNVVKDSRLYAANREERLV